MRGMQKWEYLRLTFQDGTLYNGRGDTLAKDQRDGDRMLAQIGDDGWELAGVAPGRDAQAYTLIFKRPKQAKATAGVAFSNVDV